jgi:hypothetical protein
MVCLLLATLSRALCTTCFCLGNNMRTELKMVIGGDIERRNLVESGAATIMTTRTSIMGAARGVTMMTMRTTTMIVMVAMAMETTTSVASSTPRTQCTTNVNDRREGGTRETMAIMGSSVSMISSWVWAQRGRSTPILPSWFTPCNMVSQLLLEILTSKTYAILEPKHYKKSWQHLLQYVSENQNGPRTSLLLSLL